MKKIITESELINRARGLREYLNVLEAAFDPNVKALQDKLIAAGAKIKADGFMGPATRAAQAQFPNVTTQSDAEKNAGANINSANTAPTTTTYDDGSTMSTGANGTVSSTDTSGAAYKQGSNPALTKPAAAPTAPAAPAVDPAVIADVKQIASTPLNSIPRFGVAIDPKSGQIFYGDAGDDTGAIRPKGYPFKWMQPGGPAESIKDGNRIKASGLEIMDKGGYAYIDAAKLATLGQTPAVPGTAQTNPNALDKGEEVVPTPNLQDIVKNTLNNQTAPAKESVGYGDEQILARIVELSRR